MVRHTVCWRPASFPFQKAPYWKPWAQSSKCWYGCQCCGVNIHIWGKKLYSSGPHWYLWGQPSTIGVTKRVACLEVVKICMLFSWWFIHDWLCNVLWGSCLCISRADISDWSEHEALACSDASPKVCKNKSLYLRHLMCDLVLIPLLPPDFDPNLGMMAGITPLNPMMPGLGMVPAPVSQEVPLVKEIIHCKSCTLFPPNPSKS